jgi:hypothetical protein
MEFIKEAIIDTIKLIPFLLLTFVAIEFFEHKLGKNFDDKIKNAGKLGPLIGAVLGIIPQCGFSAMSVAFYTQGYITLGTLIAVFISTSDEALPILMSTPGAAGKILPFIATKVLFAIFWGYIIDFVVSRRKLKLESSKRETEVESYDDECVDKPFNLMNITYHSLRRALKITAYIFVVNIFITIVLNQTGIHTFNGVTQGSELIQIVIASIIGLIPNCAVSIGFIQFYLAGVLSFSSLIAGLSSNAGIALIILFKESKNKKAAVNITLTLLVTSILTGIIISLI